MIEWVPEHVRDFFHRLPHADAGAAQEAGCIAAVDAAYARWRAIRGIPAQAPGPRLSWDLSQRPLLEDDF